MFYYNSIKSKNILNGQIYLNIFLKINITNFNFMIESCDFWNKGISIIFDNSIECIIKL